ncbi:MAG: DUF1367 family protein [Pseudomonadota bacterium]|nr:DUF1367 family protein [Pseudomonadota bacterium]
MADLYLTRTVFGLAATDDAGKEILRKIKVGKTVKAEITTPRNIKHHKKFFALLNTVWAATGDWASVDDLLIELKFNLGITREVVIRKTGEVVKLVGSISFASMDQQAFDLFYESAVRELCEMAGGIETDHLRQEVLQQLAAA